MNKENENRNTDFEKQWQLRFRSFARNRNDDAGIAGWSRTGLAARLRNFSRRVASQEIAGRWLDIGCGAGTYSRYLADHECSVIGVDYSYETIVKAQMKAKGDIAWAVADARHLPFRNQSFDGVICFGVIQALADSGAVIAEANRVVRAEGQIWVDALNGWCLPHLVERIVCWWRREPTHLRYESPRKLILIMQEYGLRTNMYWMPILPTRYQSLQWIVETRIVTWILRYLPFVGAAVSHAFVVRGTVPEKDAAEL